MAYEITARTPAQAAKQLHRHLLKICEGTGQSSKYVTIRKPSESEYGGWEVMWEEGPFEWAIAASMGGDIYEAELGGTGQRLQPTFPGMYETKAERTWFAEPGFSFSLGFYRR
jgi:hypothetical protein